MMSNIQAAMKVANQITFRIFDQRQFTSGEIDYLVKEFDHDKINIGGNFEKLLNLNQDACVIADTKLDDLCDSSERLARKYCDKVSALHVRLENLTNLETKYREKGSKLLSAAREQRTNRRQDYKNECEDNVTKLQESLKAEELELERKYRLFEQSLQDKCEK